MPLGDFLHISFLQQNVVFQNNRKNQSTVFLLHYITINEEIYII